MINLIVKLKREVISKVEISKVFHLSQTSYSAFNLMFLLQEERKKLTERIQNAGTEVVEAKAGAVSTANHHFLALVHKFLAKISTCS